MSPGASSRRWWTLAPVLLASALMVRLGFWQLDRLAQRRAANAQAEARWRAPRVDLNTATWPDDPSQWALRAAQANGRYAPDRGLAVKNRVFQGQTGLHLAVPLRLSGRDAYVLVVLGWLPPEEDDPAVWRAYIPAGRVTVRGRLFLPDDGPPVTPGPGFPRLWYRLDLRALGTYLDAPLAPWYLMAEPAAGEAPTAKPLRQPLTLTLSEGPHLGYAVQWFLFAALLPGLWWWQTRARAGRG